MPLIILNAIHILAQDLYYYLIASYKFFTYIFLLLMKETPCIKIKRKKREGGTPARFVRGGSSSNKHSVYYIYIHVLIDIKIHTRNNVLHTQTDS